MANWSGAGWGAIFADEDVHLELVASIIEADGKISLRG
jgi:hypothetical protein